MNSIRMIVVARFVSCVRQFMVDDNCSITSDLVTNAVCATGTLDRESHFSVLAGLPLIELELRPLVAEIADTSDMPSEIQQRYETPKNVRRDRFLVTMLAERWSHYPVATGCKAVWREVESR